MDTCGLENAKCHIYKIPSKIQNFSMISKDQKHEMCLRKNISTFLYSVEIAFVTDMRCSGHNNIVSITSYHSYKLNNHHLKSTHNILHFPNNGNRLDHPLCDLHLNLQLEAIAITAV